MGFDGERVEVLLPGGKTFSKLARARGEVDDPGALDAIDQCGAQENGESLRRVRGPVLVVEVRLGEAMEGFVAERHGAGDLLCRTRWRRGGVEERARVAGGCECCVCVCVVYRRVSVEAGVVGVVGVWLGGGCSIRSRASMAPSTCRSARQHALPRASWEGRRLRSEAQDDVAGTSKEAALMRPIEPKAEPVRAAEFDAAPKPATTLALVALFSAQCTCGQPLTEARGRAEWSGAIASLSSIQGQARSPGAAGAGLELQRVVDGISVGRASGRASCVRAR